MSRSTHAHTPPLGSQEAGVYTQESTRYAPIVSEWAEYMLERIDSGETIAVQRAIQRIGYIARDQSALRLVLGMMSGDRSRACSSLTEFGTRHLMASKQAAHQHISDACRHLDRGGLSDVAAHVRMFYCGTVQS